MGGFRNENIGIFTRSRNNFLSNYAPNASLILSNDRKHDGTFFRGVPIVHPEHIVDWKKYYILVMTKSYNEIKSQLLSYELQENVDFSRFSLSEYMFISLDTIHEILERNILDEPRYFDVTVDVRTKAEYEKILSENNKPLQYQRTILDLYKNIPSKRGVYKGVCSICGQEVDLAIDCFLEDGKGVRTLRENSLCQYCGMNGRQRSFYERVTEADPNSDIFIYEKITTMYKKLKDYFPSLIGSEYLGPEYESGSIHNGYMIRGYEYDDLMHQDALNLSFDDNSFDYIVSADVMEHVQDYKKAFSEAFRDVGFSDAYAHVHFSAKKGYLDEYNLPLIFEAVK